MRKSHNFETDISAQASVTPEDTEMHEIGDEDDTRDEPKKKISRAPSAEGKKKKPKQKADQVTIDVGAADLETEDEFLPDLDSIKSR